MFNVLNKNNCTTDYENGEDNWGGYSETIKI